MAQGPGPAWAPSGFLQKRAPQGFSFTVLTVSVLLSFPDCTFHVRNVSEEAGGGGGTNGCGS